MSDTEYRVVPLADLEALEVARLEIYEMFPQCDTNRSILLQRVTQPVWYASHRKYPTPAEHAAIQLEECNSCRNGFDGTKGQGYQPCGCQVPPPLGTES